MSGCTRKEEKLEYIDPVRDIFIFGELATDTQTKLKQANANNEFRNYQFLMLGDDAYAKTLKDINDNDVNMNEYDRVMLEIVSVKCSHCRKQLHELEKMMSFDDVMFIQYFNVGNKQEILKVYEEEGIEIPDNLMIIEHDMDFEDYIRYYLKIENYPTIITYDNGKVVFDTYGEHDENSIDRIYEISFVDPIIEDDLCDAEGNKLLDILRTSDDVKNDLSADNQKKLEDLGKKSEELTLKLMSKSFDPTVYKKTNNTIYYNEIEDYSDLMEEEVVVLYESLTDDTAKEKVEFVNNLIAADQDKSYILVLDEGADSSSEILRNMQTRFNCPVVSLLSRIPDDLMIYDINDFPSALFINKGTITGTYLNIKDSESFTNAINMFLGNESIALKKNNQQ